MPSRSIRVPKYGLHCASGQARVIYQGKHYYLGKHGSPDSLKKYAELLEFLTNSSSRDRLSRDSRTSAGGLTIEEVLVQYVDFAKEYYRNDHGKTSEFTCRGEAIRHLRHRYSGLEAEQFGPKCLRQVREDRIDQNLARTLITNRVNRIKRIFEWAVSEELVSPSVIEGLRCVPGLRYGRSRAKETEPVKLTCSRKTGPR